MLKTLATTSSLLALFAFAVACSSGESTEEESFSDDELRGAMCGGIAAIQCPTGQVCKLGARHPDASGRCVTPPAGTAGAKCGGAANLQCKPGLECEIEDDSSGPPPGAVGLPYPYARDAGPSGPPPGAVGLPIPVTYDAGSSGPPPGAVGLPIPVTYDAGGSGPPPGAVGLPLPKPKPSGICVETHSFPPGAVGMPIAPHN